MSQILPELRHSLVEMFKRRMELNLRHAGKDEQEHWCAPYATALLACLCE